MKKIIKSTIFIFFMILGILYFTINSKLMKNVIYNFTNKFDVGNNMTFEVYDNQEYFDDDPNTNGIHILINFTNENGINYIINPDGRIIYGNNKNTISIDYYIDMEKEETFKIKGNNQDEVTKPIKVTQDDINSLLKINDISTDTEFTTIEITENNFRHTKNVSYKVREDRPHWIEYDDKIMLDTLDIERETLSGEINKGTTDVCFKLEDYAGNIVYIKKEVEITSTVDNTNDIDMFELLEKKGQNIQHYFEIDITGSEYVTRPYEMSFGRNTYSSSYMSGYYKFKPSSFNIKNYENIYLNIVQEGNCYGSVVETQYPEEVETNQLYNKAGKYGANVTLNNENIADYIKITIHGTNSFKGYINKFTINESDFDLFAEMQKSGKDVSYYGISIEKTGYSQYTYNQPYEYGMGSDSGINNNTYIFTIDYETLLSRIGDNNYTGITSEFYQLARSIRSGYRSWIYSKIVVTYTDNSTDETETSQLGEENVRLERNETLTLKFNNNKTVSKIALIIREYDSYEGSANGYIRNLILNKEG